MENNQNEESKKEKIIDISPKVEALESKQVINSKINDKKQNEEKKDKEENKCIEKKKIELENGEYYIGDLFNNLKHGKGIIYYKNGNIKYEGDFITDKRDGN